MATAERPLGGGTLLFRGMVSLEPATISGRSYPELFQTGETAFGRPLVDAQHPHDFIIEAAAEYARDLGRETLYVYAAPVGGARGDRHRAADQAAGRAQRDRAG